MKVEIVPYDPNWPQQYEAEKSTLLAAFSKELGVVDHFGSTSVPGMWAKPVIDLRALCKVMPPPAEMLTKLTQMGYTHRETPETSTAKYMRFDKGDPTVTHCLHLSPERAIGVLMYREYLRKHPEARELYSEVKRALCKKDQVTMKQYREGKQTVIDRIDMQAKKWYEEEKSQGRDPLAGL